MSTASAPPRPLEQRPQRSLAARFNAADNWSGDSLDAVDVFKEYTDTSDVDGGTRPHVLDHQLPVPIAEAILTTLPLSPLYQYHRDNEQVTAWQVGSISKALIRLDTRNRTTYLLPALGDAQLDVFWMLAFSLRFRHPFTLTYLTETTVESVLSTTRPAWREGTEDLLYDHFNPDTPRISID